MVICAGFEVAWNCDNLNMVCKDIGTWECHVCSNVFDESLQEVIDESSSSKY